MFKHLSNTIINLSSPVRQSLLPPTRIPGVGHRLPPSPPCLASSGKGGGPNFSSGTTRHLILVVVSNYLSHHHVPDAAGLLHPYQPPAQHPLRPRLCNPSHLVMPTIIMIVHLMVTQNDIAAGSLGITNPLNPADVITAALVRVLHPSRVAPSVEFSKPSRGTPTASLLPWRASTGKGGGSHLCRGNRHAAYI